MCLLKNGQRCIRKKQHVCCVIPKSLQRQICRYFRCNQRNDLTNNRYGGFLYRFQRSHFEQADRQMTSVLAPLLASVLDKGIEDGILAIENTEFYTNYIIDGSLGALNRGSRLTRENIAHNLDYLPQAIANTLKIDVALLTNARNGKGANHTC